MVDVSSDPTNPNAPAALVTLRGRHHEQEVVIEAEDTSRQMAPVQQLDDESLRAEILETLGRLIALLEERKARSDETQQ